MSADCILAIDQGTTNTKAVLVDGRGSLMARASRPVETRYPQPAWVEQDPLALWESVRAAVDECLSGSAPPPTVVAITNQREATLLWERGTGRPLGPVVGWQCRRTAPFCDGLRRRGLEPLLRERTGLTIDPLFSASKARWLLDHIEDGAGRALRGKICFGTVDSWLIWNLTGQEVHATDASNASRTQLFHLARLDWDPELLDLFGLPAPMLPTVRPSSGVFGETAAHLGRLRAGIPIAGVIGDSHGALFGQGGFRPGLIKATYGTGSSLMTPTPNLLHSSHGLSSTVAWSRARQTATYALEGNIPVTGAAIEWLADLLGLPDRAQGVAALAASVNDTGGVSFVPAFVGLGAPHWNEAARGMIAGITRGTTAAHLARAGLEAIAFQIRDVFEAMRAEAGDIFEILLADGGASRNDLLMQLQADLLARPVVRSVSADAAAMGAAYLAGLATGVWGSEGALAALVGTGDRFEPQLSEAEREERYAKWKDAVARTSVGKSTRDKESRS